MSDNEPRDGATSSRVRRVVVPRGALTPDTQLTLEPDAARYVARALRLKAGQVVELMDGSGLIGRGRIASIKRGRVTLEVSAVAMSERGESPLAIALWAAIPKKAERWEMALQKCTELGVAKIAPIYTARTEINVQPGRLERRMERWQRICDEAARQCGRSRAPRLLPPESLEARLDSDAPRPSLRLAAYVGGEHETVEMGGAIAAVEAPSACVFVAGPEGGLTGEEAAALRSAGFALVGLGPRVLRAETAAIVGVGLLQYMCGDLAGGSW